MTAPAITAQTRGFWEVRCSVCQTHYRWLGRMADRPACPKCHRERPCSTVSFEPASASLRKPGEPVATVPVAPRVISDQSSVISQNRDRKRATATDNRELTTENSRRRPGDVVMPFGKYRGELLSDIAATDHGLKYLDWLFGEGIRNPGLAASVERLLHENSARLEQLLEDGR